MKLVTCKVTALKAVTPRLQSQFDERAYWPGSTSVTCRRAEGAVARDFVARARESVKTEGDSEQHCVPVGRESLRRM